MADRRIDFGKLGVLEYGVGVGLVVVCIAIVSGLASTMTLALPGYATVAAGAALGVAAWFSYLLKRNS